MTTGPYAVRGEDMPDIVSADNKTIATVWTDSEDAAILGAAWDLLDAAECILTVRDNHHMQDDGLYRTLRNAVAKARTL
jgi:hypothetical protein